MLRMWTFLLIPADVARIPALMLAIAIMVQPDDALAAPAVPTGQWDVQYSDRACTARRNFGDQMLAIRPSPLGKTMRFVVEAPGVARSVRQYRSVIDLEDRRSAIVSSSMLYPLKVGRRRGLATILGKDEAARVMSGSRFTIWAGEKMAKQVDGLPNSPKVMTVDLAVGSLRKVGAALDACVRDLQKHWGMVDGEIPDQMVSAQPSGSLVGLLRGDDYPSDAAAIGQTGETQALLMVDETGAVVDCVTMKTSGSAAIDVVVCQVMEERARFRPALDASGKPVRSTTMTPPIRFVLAR